MLESKKLELRRSEIRQELATLSAKPEPTEDELRSMEALDKEYRNAETRYRAALISEDEERRDAKDELETRSDTEWAQMMAGFELRQVALALDEGRPLDGQTAEIVSELRNAGGYRGLPVPWQALETRAGETVAAGTPDPISTRPMIDRLFPNSVASKMGAHLISIDHGSVEWPVVTQGARVGWQSSETGAVGAEQEFQTVDRALAPDHTLGVRMKISRKALKQSGRALEEAVRRDLNAAVGQEVDRVVFLGTGADGQPLGAVSGASTYGISEHEVDAAPEWAHYRTAVARFITANAAGSPSAVKVLLRPEVWNQLDDHVAGATTGTTEWDWMLKNIPARNIAMTHNSLEAPTGTPPACKSLLTTSAGGVAPIFVGAWGAVDLIRDPYSDAASGGLRLTGLATLDVTVARPTQLQVLTGINVTPLTGAGG